MNKSKQYDILPRAFPSPIRAMTPERMNHLSFQAIKPNHSQLTIKSKPTNLANFSKRIYPLNMHVDTFLTKNELRQSKGTPMAEIPDFLNDFVDNTSRLKYDAKSQLFSPTACTFSANRTQRKYRLRSKTADPNASPRRKKLIQKNEGFFTHEKILFEESRLYKPNIIYINPKSKIILYSQSPINSIGKNFRRDSSPSHGRSITPNNLTTAKEKLETADTHIRPYEFEKFQIEKPAMTFGEKLARIKDMVIDPVVNQFE
ncbi:unnamed protein product [Blepharisma stoltei]|uniref:Uncharacterized protein n=1 Tax=Blepharisma stoltei TaxID=1481888 RepID=A0AAU9K794_9CILI|nr:unnamed protein product [Blepharisma stoltei]